VEPRIISFDTAVFDFRALVRKHFGKEDLEQLHRGHNYPVFERSQDQSTEIHKIFYKIYEKDDEFLALYRGFVRHLVDLYGEALVYQKRPTFRIHMPANVAVGEFHKDSDYNHPRTEITHWMPFTPAFGTNTIWCETEEDKGDYQPWELDYGQVLIFPSPVLRHGNKINDTGVSRVSMDFRVVRLSEYAPTEVGSSHLKLKFAVGGYYDLMEKTCQGNGE